MLSNKKIFFFTICIFFIYLHSYTVIDGHFYIDVFIGELHLSQQKELVFSTDNVFYIQQGEDFFSFSESIFVSMDSDESNYIYVNDNEFTLPVEIISEMPVVFKGKSYNGFMRLQKSKANSIFVINCVDIEDYVAGVVVAEIGAGAPMEALKAQAVATRTITVKKILNSKHKGDSYDLCNTVHCQVYNGLTNQTSQSYRAAIETSGVILTYNQEPIEAVYSSSCGGISEATENLWGSSYSYLNVKTDNYCIDENYLSEWQKRYLNWTREFTVKDIERIVKLENITRLSYNLTDDIDTKTSSGRVEEIKVSSLSKTIEIEGQYKIRDAFNLPSSLFTIRLNNSDIRTNVFVLRPQSKIIFSGNGFGHGVGMCQTGAIARAKENHTYIEILEFYYPGAVLNNNWLLENKEGD